MKSELILVWGGILQFEGIHELILYNSSLGFAVGIRPCGFARGPKYGPVFMGE